MSEKFIRFNFNFFLIKFKFKFRFYFTLFFLQKFQKPNKVLVLIWITESTSRETEIIRSKSILFCSFLFASKTFKTEMTSNTLTFARDSIPCSMSTDTITKTAHTSATAHVGVSCRERSPAAGAAMVFDQWRKIINPDLGLRV